MLAGIFFFISCTVPERDHPDDPGSSNYRGVNLITPSSSSAYAVPSSSSAVLSSPSVTVPSSSSLVQSSSSVVVSSSSSGQSRPGIGCTVANNTSTQYCSDGIIKEYGSVTDEGQTYKTVEIGTQTWMAENLNYNTYGSKCYDNNEANCTTYGMLYDWATAMNLSSSCNSSLCSSQIGKKHQGMCPDGWHIPSKADWNVLMKFVDPSCSDIGGCGAGAKLKATNGWNNNGNGQDTYGFAALPGGYGFSKESNSFYDIDSRGCWWASERTANYADYHCMGSSGNLSMGDIDAKIRLFSVRCIKD